MTEYAIVGSWSENERPKGLSVFKYEDGNLQFIQNYFDDVKVGSQVFDQKNSVVYFTDEIQHPSDRFIGGGGYVLAAQFHKENGELVLLSKVNTLLVKPDYAWYDEKREHLLVVHHASTRDTITRIFKKNDGSIVNEVAFDDVATVLYRLNPDGSIGEIVDFLKHEGVSATGKNPAHNHFVMPDPGNHFFVVTDKGLDKIYSIIIKNDKLKLINTLKIADETDPRYGVFHPTENLFYCVNEKRPYLSIYEYNTTQGIIRQSDNIYLLDGTEEANSKVTASDIKHSRDYKYLYLALRRVNRLVMLQVEENGKIAMMQSINIEGSNTRGIEISPDGKYLFACNSDSDLISVFSIDNKGFLQHTNKDIQMNCPANIVFIGRER